MRLTNVYRLDQQTAGDIHISGSTITGNEINDTRDPELVFNNAIAFPGLINSHDHLDFNLFPQFGNQVYKNYTEWGKHINREYQQEISAILNIPVALRTEWGLYKNLLGGVTTVINHGEKLPVKDAPVTVIDNPQSLHSVYFEKNWKLKLNNPLKLNIPAVIHTGEGSDEAAHQEIDQLLRWNLFGRRLIGVHGVAMSAKQSKHFKAVVWCPQSNLFLLGKTAPIDVLKKNIPILFGTDSTLTGSWDIWEHIHTARQLGLLTDEELLASLTTTAAAIWRINTGEISAGHDADIVIARFKGIKPTAESILKLNATDILLVIQKGEIKLFDELLYSQLSNLKKSNFSKISVAGSYKYVYGNLPGLMKSIRGIYPDAQFPVNCTCNN